MMRNARSKIGSIVTLLVVGFVMFMALYYLPMKQCVQTANAMQVNYYYHPADGCFIQNKLGWEKIFTSSLESNTVK